MGQLPGNATVNVTADVGLNVMAVLDAAMTDSGVLWIDTGQRTYAAWFAWAGGLGARGGPGAPTAYVVNGPGEQHLPWLPPEVSLVLRSRATGGRVLRVRAARAVLDEAEPEWAAATTVLLARRLNATDGGAEQTLVRWRETCTVTALRPFGEPLESADCPETGLAATRVTSWRPAGG